jgi:hypothetical protein
MDMASIPAGRSCVFNNEEDITMWNKQWYVELYDEAQKAVEASRYLSLEDTIAFINNYKGSNRVLKVSEPANTTAEEHDRLMEKARGMKLELEPELV